MLLRNCAVRCAVPRGEGLRLCRGFVEASFSRGRFSTGKRRGAFLDSLLGDDAVACGASDRRNRGRAAIGDVANQGKGLAAAEFGGGSNCALLAFCRCGLGCAVSASLSGRPRMTQTKKRDLISIARKPLLAWIALNVLLALTVALSYVPIG